MNAAVYHKRGSAVSADLTGTASFDQERLGSRQQGDVANTKKVVTTHGLPELKHAQQAFTGKQP